MLIKETRNQKEIALKGAFKYASKKIKKEISLIGYIDDSDLTDRFLDKLSKEISLIYLKKTLNNKISNDFFLIEIKNNILKKYQLYYDVDIFGNFKACYYSNCKGLKKWQEFNNN